MLKTQFTIFVILGVVGVCSIACGVLFLMCNRSKHQLKLSRVYVTPEIEDDIISETPL
jgi:hypothetical protein